MVKHFEHLIEDHWRDWFGTPPPRQVYFAKISGNPLAEGRVIFLVFKDHDKVPCLVMKVLRANQQTPALQREFDILTRIHAKGTIPGIPYPLWYSHEQVGWVYVETPIIGKLIGNMRSPWLADASHQTRYHVRHHFSMALRWLVEFQRKTTTGHIVSDSAKVETLIRASLLAGQPITSVPPHLHRVVEQIISHLTQTLKKVELPLVCEHGDYWAGNIYLTEKGLGVIDWSDANFERLPLLDAFHFTVSYTLGFKPADNDVLWMFENLLLQRTWFYELTQQAFEDYFRQVGLPAIEPRFLIGMALVRKFIIDQHREQHNSIYHQMLDRWNEITLE